MTGLVGVPGPASPVVEGLVVAASAVGLFLYFRRPPVGRAALLASLPWVVVGVALHALGGVVDYPPVFAPALDPPGVYLLAAVLGGLAWLLVGSVVGRESRATRPRYFGVIGLGTLLPPTMVLALHGGVTAPDRLVVWLAVPLLASLVTYVVMLGLGLWLPESGYFAGSAGAVLVFALAVDGIGRALAVAFGGSVAPPLVRANRALLGPAAGPLAAASATVWLRLVLAVAVIGVLTAVARRRPQAAEHGLELATVGAAFVAAHTLLFALGGGFA